MKKIYRILSNWFFESWVWGVIVIVMVLIKSDIMEDK